MTSRHKRLYPR